MSPAPSAPPSPDPQLEAYLLTLLSDSNLPTGGFVASSGLEAWIQHGGLSLLPQLSPTTAESSSTAAPLPQDARALLAFVDHSLHSYARLTAPLLRAAHAAVWELRHQPHAALDKGKDREREREEEADDVDSALRAVLAADNLAETTTLNHVARRASVAQGGAFLALYERAFAPPLASFSAPDRVGELVKRYRAQIRRTTNPETYGGVGVGKEKGKGKEDPAYGHMPVAFAVLTAGVGLSIDASLPLSLFLHARSLLSSAVRLNVVGPYLAHRMLLWDVRALVDAATAAVSAGSSEDGEGGKGAHVREEGKEEKRAGEGRDDWWDADPFWAPIWAASTDPLSSTTASSSSASVATAGRPAPSLPSPVVTWPLGEIIASRHDQLFTKVFNS
ncbi:hypothetical protein JCM8097_006674 [Rhodosporidiobolus ruineniae]